MSECDYSHLTSSNELDIAYEKSNNFFSMLCKYICGEFEELCEHKQVYMYVGGVQLLY